MSRVQLLLEEPHAGEKPGNKHIQVDSNSKNSPDSIWHIQPTAVKMGHKHSLLCRSDRVWGPAPGPFFSCFVLPGLSLARLHTSPIGPLFCCPTSNVSQPSDSCIFPSSVQKQPSSYPLTSRFMLWAAAFANRT